MDFSFIITRAPHTKTRRTIPGDALVRELAARRMLKSPPARGYVEELLTYEDYGAYAKEYDTATAFSKWLRRTRPEVDLDEHPLEFLRQLYSEPWRREVGKREQRRFERIARKHLLWCLANLSFQEVQEELVDGRAYWITGDTSGGSYPPDSYNRLAFIAECGVFDKPFSAKDVARAEAALAQTPTQPA